MATRRTELKPPPELVEAIQNSEDHTAPGLDTSAEFTGNTPRSIRNRVLHETPAPIEHEEDEQEAEERKLPKIDKRLLEQRARFMEQKAAGYQDTHGGFITINKSVSTKGNAMQSASNKNLNPRNKQATHHQKPGE